jgi:hypothetical protein
MPRRSGKLALATAMLACLGACDVTLKRPPADARTEEPSQRVRLAFAPVRMAVHPLSRIVEDPRTGGRRIEAHVELIDAYDHLVKAMGEFRFEISEVGGEPLRLPDGSRMLWRIDAKTPARASAPFDPLTRTYRFVLTDLPSGRDRETLRLRVTFSPPSGERLNAERDVRLDSIPR